jgi:hypothetical protein
MAPRANRAQPEGFCRLGNGEPGREQRHADLVADHLRVRVLDLQPNAITGTIGSRGAFPAQLRDLAAQILHLSRVVT